LKPNEKLVVRNEEVVKPSAPANVPDKKAPPEPLIQLGYINFLENDSTAIETSWLYDRLVFDDESLQDISQKLERWYGVHIAIAEPRIATQRLTYTIKKETIEEALDNMRYALRFNYTKDGNNIVITR
jgi:ferric-dicitrate binding protein FerR (iron transport regulator)